MRILITRLFPPALEPLLLLRFWKIDGTVNQFEKMGIQKLD
jgi:hypothetical protein